MYTSTIITIAGGIVLLAVALSITIIASVSSRRRREVAALERVNSDLVAQLRHREARVETLQDELRSLTAARDVERARAEELAARLAASKEEMQRLFSEQVA